MNISEQIILEMSSHLLNEGRIIFMDNWYSSPLLYQRLLEQKTFAVGTVRCNRKNFPKEVATQKLSKGELTFMSCNNVLCLKWQDRKTVSMLSTVHSTPDYVEVTSQRGKKRLKPIVVHDYNQSMCGVDKEDEKLSSFPVMRRYSKGYKKLFFYLMDVTAYNASIVHNIKTGKKQTMSEFRVNLAEQIIQNITIPEVGAVGRPSTAGDTPTRLQAKHWGHFIVKIPRTTKERNARRCKVCTANNKRSETVWWCKKCEVPLHIENCFEQYHT
uniref:PiggyBac transposable element-derived protein domain-containing protein n=1 Tax=Cuerna arida TaxID=1464854 RepID=A0A1B6FUY6_9HEMI